MQYKMRQELKMRLCALREENVSGDKFQRH